MEIEKQKRIRTRSRTSKKVVTENNPKLNTKESIISLEHSDSQKSKKPTKRINTRSKTSKRKPQIIHIVNSQQSTKKITKNKRMNDIIEISSKSNSQKSSELAKKKIQKSAKSQRQKRNSKKKSDSKQTKGKRKKRGEKSKEKSTRSKSKGTKKEETKKKNIKTPKIKRQSSSTSKTRNKTQSKKSKEQSSVKSSKPKSSRSKKQPKSSKSESQTKSSRGKHKKQTSQETNKSKKSRKKEKEEISVEEEEEEAQETEESSSTSEEIVPFLQQMSFRRRNRGNKIKQLIEQEEKLDQLDEFWLGNTYFGQFEDVQNEEDDQLQDNQEYSLEESQSDSFDSDFEATMNQKEEYEETEDTSQKKVLRKRKFVENDKPRKKTYKFFKPQKDRAVRVRKTRKRKTIDDIDHQMTTRRKAAGISRKRLQIKAKKKKPVDPAKAKRKYIHHYFSQKHLLREAAKTEILNIKSLEDLILLEEKKKRKINKRNLRDPGPKIYIKDFL